MSNEHQVRERAYFIWEDEGRVFGRADAHWFQAEAELGAASADAVLSVEAVIETSAPVKTPAKTLKPAATRAKAKAEKAPAKAASKAEAPKAALKARRTPRTIESGAPLH